MPRDLLSPLDSIILLAGGLCAGVVNTLAGGGSLLTVPLLVLVGLPGTLANGTNRIGIFVQCLVATGWFRSQGISEFRNSIPVVVPLCVGSALGAMLAARLADATFERAFGVAMLALLVPTLREAVGSKGSQSPPPRQLPPPLAKLMFFGIGLYAGAIQAGAGLFLLFALNRTGYDLVRANAIKMIVIAALTLTAIPVFIWEGQIAWLPAIVLACGFSLGGALGARVAIGGGERVIRFFLAISIGALAGRMLGVY